MFATLHAAADAIRERRATPLEVLDQCLTQIDRWEGKIAAWVFIDREWARAEATRLTEELKQGKYRGPLHGVPIGIKDIFDVFDWPTAAGSKLWARSVARKDSPVVEPLRQAGAVFPGKTVATQYASFDPAVTPNPWNAERTPGGSRRGSAGALGTAISPGSPVSRTS